MRSATTSVGVAAGTAALLAGAALTVGPATAGADPGAHQITYTVTTGSELNAHIYYMATQPPSKSAFNADSSKYMTNVEVNVNPGAPWVMQATLDNPDQWAIVTASGVLRTDPHFHCEIAVDGKVVVTQDGGSGVQCALPGSQI